MTAHKNLSAQTHDSETIHRVSGHLLRIRRDLYELSEQVQQGQLPESAQACVRLERLIAEAPEPLDKAVIMTSIQVRLENASSSHLSDLPSRRDTELSAIGYKSS